MKILIIYIWTKAAIWLYVKEDRDTGRKLERLYKPSFYMNLNIGCKDL